MLDRQKLQTSRHLELLSEPKTHFQVVTNLQQMSLAPLLLPMEAADLVCMAQMGRDQVGQTRGLRILEEILEKRNVNLYKKNYQKLQKRLETWKTNFEQNLTLSNMEFQCFSSFRIEIEMNE